MAFVQLMGYNPVLQPRLCLLDWIGLVRLAFGIALLAGITLLELIWLGIALLGLVGLALEINILVFRRKGLPLGTVLLCAIF